ncbi:MAG: hypothetical protein P8K05_00700, partial [Dehalococcoidia bacterium]|nr:hypothetical protein [Dehalococcoidia bacterium]
VQITKELDINLNEIDPIELSMSFSLIQKEIHVLIIGSKNKSHVKANLEFMQEKKDNMEILINQYQNMFEKLDDNWRQLT